MTKLGKISRRTLLATFVLGQVATAAPIPAGIGGVISGGFDGAVPLDVGPVVSTGPSAMALSIERSSPTVLNVNGTAPTATHYPLSYDWHYSLDGTNWNIAAEAAWKRSRLLMLRSMPPGKQVWVRGRAVDAQGNVGPWAQISATMPVYQADNLVLLTPLGGRPAYGLYLTDVGQAVATLSTNVSGGVFTAVSCNGYFDNGNTTSTHLNSSVQDSPQFSLSGNQLILSAAPTISSNWRGGVINLQFEITDGTGNIHTAGAYMAVLSAAVDTTTAPVPNAGNVAMVNQGLINGNLYVPQDLDLGQWVATVDYVYPQNGFNSGTGSSFVEVSQNPNFAFSVEYEAQQPLAVPGNLVKTFSFSSIRIKRVGPLPPGSYTLQLAIYTSFPASRVNNTAYFNGDYATISNSDLRVLQCTSSNGGTTTSSLPAAVSAMTTVGQTATDGTVTWTLMSTTGSVGGGFLPCLLNINVIVPATPTKQITMTPLYSGTLTSCNPHQASIAQVTGQGGFTPVGYAIIPDVSTLGGLSRYFMDVGGVVRISTFPVPNRFDCHGVGVVTAVSGNTVTIGSGSWSPAWYGVVGFAKGVGTSDCVEGPGVLPRTKVVSANTTTGVVTLSASAAGIPIGSVIRCSTSVTGVVNACMAAQLACGLDGLIVSAVDASGNVAWLRWNNYVAFPSSSVTYTLGGTGAAPAANGYPQDSLDGLFGALQAEWANWALTGTIPPSAGCTVYLPAGAGENPDGSYTYNGHLGQGIQSSPPVPMKIVGVPSAGTLPKIWFPRTINDTQIKALFGFYWDLGVQLVEVNGAYQYWNGGNGGDNLDLFAPTTGGAGTLIVDLVYGHNGDSMFQRGWNFSNCVEASNTVGALYGNWEAGLPLETVYVINDCTTLSDFYAIGEGGADIIKSRGIRVFGDNVFSADSVGGGSKLIGSPAGGDWTLGKVTLHRSMQAMAGNTFFNANEKFYQNRVNDIFTARDVTFIADVFYNAAQNSSSQQLLPIFGSSNWFARGQPGKFQIDSFNFWTMDQTRLSVLSTFQGGLVAYPPWINTGSTGSSPYAGITKLDGMTPFVMPAMLSTRPDLSAFYAGPPGFQAMGITLGNPDAYFEPRNAQTASGGSASVFVGFFNLAPPMADVYTDWTGLGAVSHFGLGAEVTIPHAASGVVGRALIGPNPIEISPLTAFPTGTTTLTGFNPTGFRECMSIGQPIVNVACHPWFNQSLAAGTTISYAQPTFSLSSATFVSGGSGYPANQTGMPLTIAGGTNTTPAVVLVNTNASGSVSSISGVSVAGSYTIPPDYPAPTVPASGGSGCFVKPNWVSSGYSNNPTISQPTVGSTDNTVLSIPASSIAWAPGSFTVKVASTAVTNNWVVGDAITLYGMALSAMNGQQIITAISRAGGVATLTFNQASIVTSGSPTQVGLLVKRAIFHIDAMPASAITWSVPQIKTSSGNTTCFSIDSAGNISYDGSQAAGGWACVCFQYTLFGTSYVWFNRFGFVRFT